MRFGLQLLYYYTIVLVCVTFCTYYNIIILKHCAIIDYKNCFFTFSQRERDRKNNKRSFMVHMREVMKSFFLSLSLCEGV